MENVYWFAATFAVVMLALGWYLGRRSDTKSAVEVFATMDADTRLWLFTFVGLGIGIVTSLGAIAALLVFRLVDPVVVSLVSTYNGIVLGATVTTSYNFWLGSSASSKKKDEALANATQGSNQEG